MYQQILGKGESLGFVAIQVVQIKNIIDLKTQGFYLEFMTQMFIILTWLSWLHWYKVIW